MKEIISKFNRVFEGFSRAPKWLKITVLALVILFAFEDLVLGFDNLVRTVPVLGIKTVKAPNLNNPKPLKLVYNNQSFTVYPKDLGAQLSVSPTYSQLLKYGRRGNIAKRVFEENKALLGFVGQKEIVRLSPGLAAVKMLDISSQVEIPVMPPRPDFTGDLAKTIPAKDGLKVDDAKLIAIFEKDIFNPPDSPLTVPTSKIAADTNYNLADLDQIRLQVKKLTKTPISITSGGVTLTLNQNDILSMLTVVAKPNPADPKKQSLVLKLDDTKLNRKLDSFASQVEAKTQTEFNYQDARAVIYGLFYSENRPLIAIATGTRSGPANKVLGSSTQSGHKVLYLTFDDGPDPLYHPLIVDILKSHGINATFFLIGRNAQKYPDLVATTLANGNVIGNHSLTHPFLPNLPAGAILDELTSTSTLLQGMENNLPIALFRPPYGGTNALVYSDAAKIGEKLYLWDIDPRDWSEPATDDLVNRVVSHAHDGAVILMHSNHEATVKALPIILDQLKAAGFEFKTLM